MFVQVLFTKKEKSALIEAEILAGPTDMVIYLERLRSWEPPHDHKVISPDEKRRMRENITQELKGKGLVIDWD